MKRRIVILLLTLCMVMGLLVSCGGGGSETTTTAPVPDGPGGEAGTETTSATSAQTTVAPPQGLVIVPAGGKSDYTIMRADLADSVVVQIAIELHGRFADAYGKDAVKIGTDWVKKNELDEKGQVTNDAHEILIGQTNRVETELALSRLEKGNDYIITVVGEKLVIAGRNSLSTKAGVLAFAEQFVKKSDDGLVLDRELTVQGKGEALAVELSEGAEFRIMTFNVAGSNGEPEKRYAKILEVIGSYEPDIVGFQEFNSAQHSNVMDPLLREGYGVVARKHSSGTYNQTPIAYRKDKFDLVEGGVEWLDGRYTGTNTKSISWAVLKDKATGKTFGVINLHGAVVSTDYKGYENMSATERNKIVNEWRIDNVRQMLEIETRLKATHGEIAFFFTGDFNFNNSSDAYNATKRAGLTEAEVSATLDKMPNIATYHGFSDAPAASGKSIDHIFYRAEKAWAVRHYVAGQEAFEITSSDHFAVFADVAVE